MAPVGPAPAPVPYTAREQVIAPAKNRRGAAAPGFSN